MVETTLAVPFARQADGHATIAYNPALDGMRAVAILLVLLFHARVPGFEVGFLGVDVFFVLSGYLITTLLLSELARNGNIDWRRFVLRRVFRLGPALAALCLGMLIMSVWVWPSSVSPWLEVLIAMTYMSDLTVPFLNLPQVLGHSWSLSVEEHFYLVWPVVLLLFVRADRMWIVAAIGLCFLLATAWRIQLTLSGRDWYEIYFRLDTRLSGLMFGALLSSVVWAAPAGAWRRVPLWPVGLILATFVILVGDWDDPWYLIFGVPLIEIASATFILSCLSGCASLRFVLSVAPMVWLGKRSYSLYLWHFPVFLVFREQMDWPMSLALGLPLSLGLACASYVTVERWGLASRDRLFTGKFQ